MYSERERRPVAFGVEIDEALRVLRGVTTVDEYLANLPLSALASLGVSLIVVGEGMLELQRHPFARNSYSVHRVDQCFCRSFENVALANLGRTASVMKALMDLPDLLLPFFSCALSARLSSNS